MDQANNLRDLVRTQTETKTETQKPEPKPSITSRVIAVTSGKGGVGKTNFTINLAINLSRQNKRVVILDTDFGLANIEVLLGIIPKFNFGDVLDDKITIEEALTNGPSGIKFLSGGSGLSSLADINESQMTRLLDSFTFLDSISDYILIDTGAGISKSVINFVKASNETIIVTTPEPTSITDAYAIIKTLKEENSQMPEFKIVVNKVDDYKEGAEIFDKLSKVADKFLGVKLQSLGTISHDNYLVRAVKMQQPVTICFPNAESAKSIESISLRLLNMESRSKDGIMSFMKRLVNIFNN